MAASLPERQGTDAVSEDHKYKQNERASFFFSQGVHEQLPGRSAEKGNLKLCSVCQCSSITTSPPGSKEVPFFRPSPCAVISTASPPQSLCATHQNNGRHSMAPCVYAVRLMRCTPLSVKTGWLSSPTCKTSLSVSKPQLQSSVLPRSPPPFLFPL